MSININILQTMALLNTNYLLPTQKDYVDIFMPFVMSCIRQSNDRVISSPKIQRLLSQSYGLSLPQDIITNLLKRAQKRKLLIAEHKILMPDWNKISEFEKKTQFIQNKESVTRRYELLIISLIDFAKNKNEDWVFKLAEDYLFEYLDLHGVTIISSLVSGIKLKHTAIEKQKGKGWHYVVASFILYCEQESGEDFEYLESIVQGNILASSVYLTDTGKLRKKLDSTDFYFDTTFIIYALGYAGQSRADACLELLQLLRNNNANLYCFEHTVLEIEAALSASAQCLSPLNNYVPYGPTGEYFLAESITEADVLRFRATVKDDIPRKLRIDICDIPNHGEWTIDEVELDEALNKYIDYRHEEAKRKDIASLSAIMRIREGKNARYLEDCKAVFITTNLKLAKVSKDFFALNKSDYQVPPCITDYRLTAHVWLKSPTQAPTVSRKRLVADCFAAIQPTENFWEKYLLELDKLKNEDCLTEELYFILRYDMSVRKQVMESTKGDEDVFDDECTFVNATVPELLSIARKEVVKKIEEEHQVELDDERLKKEKAQAERDEALLQQLQTSHSIDELKTKHYLIIDQEASRKAKRIILVLKVILFLFIISGLAISLLSRTIIDTLSENYACILIGLSFFMAMLTFLNIWFGVSIKGAILGAECFFKKRIKKRLQETWDL